MSVKQEETQAQDAQFTLVFPSKTMDTRKTRQKNEDINGWNYICTYELIMYVYTTNEDTDYMENDKR